VPLSEVDSVEVSAGANAKGVAEAFEQAKATA
jgi:hypothetical protein